jgi:hypothetical protein
MIMAQVRHYDPSHYCLSSARSQLALLYICIRYRPRHSPESLGASARPFSFWQWHTYSQYIEFLAGLMYALFRNSLRDIIEIIADFVRLFST